MNITDAPKWQPSKCKRKPCEMASLRLPVNLCALLICQLDVGLLFFFYSYRPSIEAVCRLRSCRIAIDFSDGKTLRSLDLSEQFRAAASDNEKESREG